MFTLNVCSVAYLLTSSLNKLSDFGPIFLCLAITESRSFDWSPPNGGFRGSWSLLAGTKAGSTTIEVVVEVTPPGLHGPSLEGQGLSANSPAVPTEDIGELTTELLGVTDKVPHTSDLTLPPPSLLLTIPPPPLLLTTKHVVAAGAVPERSNPSLGVSSPESRIMAAKLVGSLTSPIIRQASSLRMQLQQPQSLAGATQVVKSMGMSAAAIMPPWPEVMASCGTAAEAGCSIRQLLSSFDWVTIDGVTKGGKAVVLVAKRNVVGRC